MFGLLGDFLFSNKNGSNNLNLSNLNNLKIEKSCKGLNPISLVTEKDCAIDFLTKNQLMSDAYAVVLWVKIKQLAMTLVSCRKKFK